MLAVVKAPHTEMVLNGEQIDAILEFLRTKFEVEVVSPSPTDEPTHEEDDELIDIEESEFWRNNCFRILAGYRLRAGITQKQLAAMTGIRQSVISEYERGKRNMTLAAAIKFGKALNVEPERLMRAAK